jgi:hypothetical protein
MTDQVKPGTTASTTASPTKPAPTTTSTPAKKPLLPIYAKGDYLCTCGRAMSRTELIKNRDIGTGEENYTGEVIVNCNWPQCSNHGRKIKVQMIEVKATEA